MKWMDCDYEVSLLGMTRDHIGIICRLPRDDFGLILTRSSQYDLKPFEDAAEDSSRRRNARDSCRSVTTRAIRIMENKTETTIS